MPTSDLVAVAHSNDSLSLRDLARWYWCLHDDMGYPGVESPDELTKEQILAILREQFISSDCGDFAVALNELTGWRLVNLVSPVGGRVHSGVLHPAGKIVDFLGFTTLAALRVRYGVFDLMMEESTPANIVGRSDNLDWDDEEINGVDRAKAAMLFCDYPPFDSITRTRG